MTLFKVRIQKANPRCGIQTQSAGVAGILCFSCRTFMISNWRRLFHNIEWDIHLMKMLIYGADHAVSGNMTVG